MCTAFFGPTTPIICCPFLTVPCCRRPSRRRDSRRSDFSLRERARDAGLKALRSSRQAGATRAKSLTPPDFLNAQKLILLVDFCAPQGAPLFLCKCSLQTSLGSQLLQASIPKAAGVLVLEAAECGIAHAAKLALKFFGSETGPGPASEYLTMTAAHASRCGGLHGDRRQGRRPNRA
jgi:hypothetical protein